MPSTGLVIAIALLLATRLALIVSEQLPRLRAADLELLRAEAEHGPAWVYEWELELVADGLELIVTASELGDEETVRRASEALAVALGEAERAREEGKRAARLELMRREADRE